MTDTGTDPFPADYFAARDAFRKLAGDRGWRLDSLPIDAEGPAGEKLTIDAAVSPDHGPDRLLLVTSGLHGVEAPLGSAVQLELLRRWPLGEADKSGVGCVLIHVLNPYGYAWSRRYDAENIDPNRNFLLDGESYSRENPLYARFDPLLNPSHAPARVDFFLLRAAWAIMCHGKQNLKQAIAEGQYDWPRGLFYGGQGPCQTKQILTQHLRSWIGKPRVIGHLDFHTGLGKWGTHQLLVDYPMTGPERRRMIRWFGTDIVDELQSGSIAYETSGGFGQWCRAQQYGDEYLYACAEFGTYSDVRVLAGLRAENQAHHRETAGEPETRRAKRRLRELFCPGSHRWRRKVLRNGMQLIDKAIMGLQSERLDH